MIRVGKAVRVMRVLRTVRLLRLAKVRHLLSMVQDNLDSEYFSTIVKITKYIVFLIAINHCIACGWRRLGLVHVPGYGSWLEQGGIEFRSYEYQYLTSLHWSLTQFTPASMEVQPTNVYERGFAIVVLLFALCVFSSFVSSITSAMTSLRDLSVKHEHQSFLLRRYLRERHISRPLSLRIRRFVALAVGDLKTKGDHVTLLKTLSPLLRLELKTELYMPNLAAHPFFKKITHPRSPVLRALCQFALKELALSHLDVLFGMGGAATAMYWLRVGGTLDHLGARGLHDREGRVRGIDPGCKAVPGGHASPARICEGREKLCHLVRGEPRLFPGWVWVRDRSPHEFPDRIGHALPEKALQNALLQGEFGRRRG